VVVVVVVVDVDVDVVVDALLIVDDIDARCLLKKGIITWCHSEHGESLTVTMPPTLEGQTPPDLSLGRLWNPSLRIRRLCTSSLIHITEL
jgi:hypothetical protein